MIVAILVVIAIAWWWFSSLAKMRRDVEQKTKVFMPRVEKNDAYNSVVAFIRRHINLDNRADDDGVD